MKPTLLTAALALLATASGAALAEPSDENPDLTGGGGERATVLGQISEIRGDVHYARYAVDLDNDGVTDRWVVRARTIGAEREDTLNASPVGRLAGARGELIPTGQAPAGAGR